MVKTKYLRRHFIEKAVQNFKPSGRILEIGSGDKWRYYADSITLNRDKSANPDIIGDGENLQFKNDSFDSIVCLEVLEHTPSPKKMIDEIYRVLKPGGRLLLTVPFIFEIHDKQDYYRFTRQGLAILLKKFRFIIITNNGGKYCVIFHFLRLNLLGMFIYPLLNNIGYLLDYLIHSEPSITLGYTVIATK